MNFKERIKTAMMALCGQLTHTTTQTIELLEIRPDDQLIIQTEATLCKEKILEIKNQASIWLNGDSRALILTAGLKLFAVRKHQNINDKKQPAGIYPAQRAIKLGVNDMKSIREIVESGYQAFRQQLTKDEIDETLYSKTLPEAGWYTDAWIAATRHIVEQANQVH